MDKQEKDVLNSLKSGKYNDSLDDSTWLFGLLVLLMTFNTSDIEVNFIKERLSKLEGKMEIIEKTLVK